MATNTVLTFTSTYANDLAFTSGMDPRVVLNSILNHLAGGLNGSHGVSGFNVRDTAVAASGTVTCASVSAADTVTLNGVTFTAVAGAAGANQFSIDGNDTADGAALASAINASVSAAIVGVVTATAASGVVTITAAQPGKVSNAITLASSNGTRLALGGLSNGRLSGGSNDTALAFTL
ncbi:MAG TPA: hypothetical protein VMY76_00650 [Gemmatimonadales bacterium]|nr:hypothetical protein [Gemmatimonadales bacterium]